MGPVAPTPIVFQAPLRMARGPSRLGTGEQEVRQSMNGHVANSSVPPPIPIWDELSENSRLAFEAENPAWHPGSKWFPKVYLLERPDREIRPLISWGLRGGFSKAFCHAAFWAVWALRTRRTVAVEIRWHRAIWRRLWPWQR